MPKTYTDCYQFDLLLATVKNKSELNSIIDESNNRKSKILNKNYEEKENIFYEDA